MNKTSNLIKCVVVGDGYVGKTSLVTRLCSQEYNENYIPTVFDNNSVFKEHNGQTFQVVFYDTAGQEEFQMLRQQIYDAANMFLVCFSISSVDSFSNVKELWFPEIQNYKDASRILIGIKSDLRDDPDTIDKLNENRNHFVSNEMAQYFATLLKMKYVECSALTRENTDDLWAIILETYSLQTRNQSSSNICCISPVMRLFKRALCCKNQY